MGGCRPVEDVRRLEYLFVGSLFGGGKSEYWNPYKLCWELRLRSTGPLTICGITAVAFRHECRVLPHLARIGENKTSVYKEIDERIRRDANGTKQVAFVGITDPSNLKLETADGVVADIL